MANTPELPALGVGMTYSAAIEPLLEREPDLIQVLEIEPQTTWIKMPNPARPYKVKEEVLDHLLHLPGRKIIHSIGTPVGGTVRPEPAQLDLLRATIKYFDAPWASDHLSFNKTPEFATGFFLPPRQTPAGVETVTASIRDLQNALPVPIAVETGVNYLRPRPEELPDGDFTARVVEGANCGLLLDMHNVYANSLNGRQPLDEFLSQIPLDRVWEMHLAGGMEMDGFWLDAHSGAIPDPLYEFVATLIPRLPNLKAIIFEVFPSFVPVVGLDLVREQILRLKSLWSMRSRKDAGASISRPDTIRDPKIEKDGSPESWERALGNLVIGRTSEDEMSRQLEHDPGVKIVGSLIYEFRASMIVGVLRLSTRLMILAMGAEALRTIFADYFSKVPPQMYGTLEAAAFADYMKQIDLRVPHLAKMIEFECAILDTLTDDQTRVVHFDFEPIPLLRALAEGRLPENPGMEGDFEIELTADGPTGIAGLEPEAIQQAFPYH